MKSFLPIFTLPFLILPFLNTSCGSSVESSETKWAHTEVASSTSVINSRLNFIALGFNRDFDKLSVCVQDATHFKGKELLLETKLAYAAWLEASGLGSDAQWSYLKFEQRSYCNMKDNRYGSVVVIGEEARITPDQEVSKSFQRSRLTCSKTGDGASCSSGNMLLGLGGAGGVSLRSSRPQIWESVSNAAPATIILSPYVQWTSMSKTLSNTKLNTLYQSLSAKASSVTYAELTAFNRQLTLNSIKQKGDERLDAILEDFLYDPRPSLSQIYLPEQAAYHVLLHEVGHQFGMDHADNPARDAETGTSGSAKQNSYSGQWETTLSTMAYADGYFYLTPDDIAGINHLAKKNLALVKSRRGF
jgi:hypothetical protein